MCDPKSVNVQVYETRLQKGRPRKSKLFVFGNIVIFRRCDIFFPGGQKSNGRRSGIENWKTRKGFQSVCFQEYFSIYFKWQLTPNFNLIPWHSRLIAHYVCANCTIKYLLQLIKSWKDNIKEWTDQSMSSLLCLAEDRRRCATITVEASVGVPQRCLGVTGFDWLSDLIDWNDKIMINNQWRWGIPEIERTWRRPSK